MNARAKISVDMCHHLIRTNNILHNPVPYIVESNSAFQPVSLDLRVSYSELIEPCDQK